VVEFFLKSDELHDPLLNYHHMRYLRLMTKEEAEEIERIMYRVNEVLNPFLESKGLLLYDFKLEFGRTNQGELKVGDEITLDSMRVRDAASGRIYDKDLYRSGAPLDMVKKSYAEFLAKISR